MDYRLKLSDGTIITRLSGDACVLWLPATRATVLATAGRWSSLLQGVFAAGNAVATRPGTAFQFALPGYAATVFVEVSLSLGTLAAAAVGGRVLVEAAAGTWQEALIMGTGDAVLVGAAVLPSTARAATLLDGSPAIGDKFIEGPVAEDGSRYWTDTEGTIALHTSALTAVGALTSPPALVETGKGEWIWTTW